MVIWRCIRSSWIFSTHTSVRDVAMTDRNPNSPLQSAISELRDASDEAILRLLVRKLRHGRYSGLQRLNLPAIYRDKHRDVSALKEEVAWFSKVMRGSVRPGFVELAMWISIRRSMIRAYRQRGWIDP